ncbi:hypothetical protein [Bacillus sp. AFS053548]|uniref:hypothetical protein n=1 Tax=Bacillus sp. AFS053548 TaxID=2033505 RepID=UPI000BFDD321|nr:hypothetical protein [Bacillus sp. AFS053548]PGM56921.1 hypothetical protein CN946_08180 [Bacillus sp. AFS053548]
MENSQKVLKNEALWAVFLTPHFLFAIFIISYFMIWCFNPQDNIVIAAAISSFFYFFVDFFISLQESNDKQNPDLVKFKWLAFGAAFLCLGIIPLIVPVSKVEYGLAEFISFITFTGAAVLHALKQAIPTFRELKKLQ